MNDYWGRATYSGGERVPLRAARCATRLGQGNAHKCRRLNGHEGGCRCICGMTSEQAGVTA